VPPLRFGAAHLALKGRGFFLHRIHHLTGRDVPDHLRDARSGRGSGAWLPSAAPSWDPGRIPLIDNPRLGLECAESLDGSVLRVEALNRMTRSVLGDRLYPIPSAARDNRIGGHILSMARGGLGSTHDHCIGVKAPDRKSRQRARRLPRYLRSV
jgi:hypothetical protein